MAVCERCGVESPSGFRFCGACGAPLPEDLVALRQTRKMVTALFCDVTGSTALGEELDPEVLRGVMNRYFAVIRTTIERHGGTVEKFIGDAVMAVFGIPIVREDDALRAVRAAAEIRERLPEVAEEVGVTLRFRTGVNTGTVLMSEGENYATGDAVNVAARFEQVAAPGEIVLGEETLRLVRDAVVVEPLEQLALKGKSDPVRAFRLMSVDPAAAGVARHMDSMLVGRERELSLVRDAWERVVREAGCHLFTLLGMAGVGKSRLVAELLHGIGDDALVLVGRCLAYGEGITFWPLIDALQGAGESARLTVERLRHGGAAIPQELFLEVRRTLESLAQTRPVVLHIDDLQWAEAMLLDLLDHVVDLSRGAPILVLCTARPELLEERPAWGGGKFNAQTVLLEPLGSEESLALLDQIGNGLDAAARGHIVAASEGNPLFLEEMVALTRESGAVQVPSTIHALLAARLERLGAEERALLERGAVEGEVFHRLAVKALADERLVSQVDTWLAGLVRRELIRPHPAVLRGDDAYRFRHLLIRDAAYDALPKAQRAELHERFADWLEQAAAGLPELDEIVGWHLEQTVRYRQELGQRVEPSVRGRAARCLYRGGQRAGHRGDRVAADSLLQRALDLTPEDDHLHASIAIELADQLVETGELERMAAALAAAERDPGLRAFAALIRFELVVRSRPHEAMATFEPRLPEIIAEFERRDDVRGLARAHFAWAIAYVLAARATPWAEHMALAADYAQRAGDDGLRARALSWYVSALWHGLASAEEVRRAIEAIDRDDQGAYQAGGIDLGRGWLAQAEGDFERARELTRRARDTYTEMGAPVMAGACHQELGDTELVAGDPDAAAEVLRRGDRLLAELVEYSYRSTVVAMLAWANALRGDREGALAAAELAEELSAPEDVLNFIYTHQARSALALAEGDLDAAERWARSALDYATPTDLYQSLGEAQLQLGRVMAARGSLKEAAEAARAALDIFERKGDRPRTEHARAELEALGA
ncbi:MAG TPA: adenylate/guanylate cyclase domain-containing protein [Solirubrobacteraceae bacterium]|nr:adenylate/guanylate cyclase domain-containing protein [Solirubrobacteraceae bacterium]